MSGPKICKLEDFFFFFNFMIDKFLFGKNCVLCVDFVFVLVFFVSYPFSHCLEYTSIFIYM